MKKILLKSSKYILFALLLSAFNIGCNWVYNPDESAQNSLKMRRVTALFNEPGSRSGQEADLLADQMLIDRINGARYSINCAVYGFTNKKILNALIKAHLRGVKVRVAGDARHFVQGEVGFRLMQQYHIPLQVGNEHHIMHDKFFVFDQLYVVAGTGNITPTGFYLNDNNWLLIEDPGVAARFNAEFEQMFSGKFSTAKIRQSSTLPNTWQVGDTKVEVYFSPEDDTMSRMMNEVAKADTNIYFTIFAFTEDRFGSLMVQKHNEFVSKMTADELKRSPVSFDKGVPAQPKVVTGVLDRSQVQGNGLYHEVYRMASNGIPMRLDANEHTYTPGDYQTGGGRLHSKTIILDRGTPNARVVTGSFNWSSSASIANDELLFILHGQEITEQYYQAFSRIYRKSKDLATGPCNYYSDAYKRDKRDILCPDQVVPGDVVISEVYWAGWNGTKDDRYDVRDDQFIELYNTTKYPIDLSLWTINSDQDVMTGFTPGTVIQPHSYFYIAHHNIPDSGEKTNIKNGRLDTKEKVAFLNPDFVINTGNDPRLGLLPIHSHALKLRLIAPASRLDPSKPAEIDVAGDGGPAFAGEFNSKTGAKSMVRKFKNGKPYDGTAPQAWASATKQGKNINSDLPDAKKIFATPGEGDHASPFEQP